MENSDLENYNNADIFEFANPNAILNNKIDEIDEKITIRVKPTKINRNFDDFDLDLDLALKNNNNDNDIKEKHRPTSSIFIKQTTNTNINVDVDLDFDNFEIIS